MWCTVIMFLIVLHPSLTRWILTHLKRIETYPWICIE
jgi:hypothetical protein